MNWPIAINVLCFVYVFITGCIVFGLFKAPWYAAVDISMQSTHHLEETVQATCMLWATVIAMVVSVMISGLVYYIMMRRKSSQLHQELKSKSE